jgi:DNA-binding PadR family transcriptional regulator
MYAGGQTERADGERGVRVSPVFRHGLLRLYLLKLLDEAPRHGYDVIRLLQDRFLGVYSPSPGTIYPRLARLEEEGLVTHDLIGGKKVYKITDAGRDELNRRLDDLAELEDQLSASVRDIAREISRDVRETVRNLRDELTWAVREAGRSGREDSERATNEGDQADDRGSDRDRRDDSRAGTGTRAPGDWREWANWREWASWAERTDWREWADWAKQQDWSDWPGMREWRERAGSKQEWKEQAKAWKDQARAGKWEWKEQAKASRDHWDVAGLRERRGNGGNDRDLAADLEHLAAAFAGQIRGLARHAEAISDEAMINLGKILGDALSRIGAELFGTPERSRSEARDEHNDEREAPDEHEARDERT